MSKTTDSVPTAMLTSLPSDGVAASSLTPTGPILPNPYVTGAAVDNGPMERNKRLLLLSV